MYECNWWLNGPLCSEFTELAKLVVDTTGHPMGIAVNGAGEILSVRGNDISKYVRCDDIFSSLNLSSLLLLRCVMMNIFLRHLCFF